MTLCVMCKPTANTMSHITRPTERHIINADQIGGYENTTVIASAFGNGNNKKLVLWTYISYANIIFTKVQVWNKNVKVFESDSLEEGIATYNEF